MTDPAAGGDELLEKKIQIRFKNKALLAEALTHKSYAMEQGGMPFNERLEFLGDSVFNTAISAFLFGRYPDVDEGRLSKLKSQLVARASLLAWGRELKIGNFLKLSDSEEMTGGRERESLTANVMEALIGAIFLDQGFEPAREFILSHYEKKKRIIETDYKSKLQELIQKKHKMPPVYVVIGETGPDHDKTFEIEVRIKKKLLGKGEGKSKKEAEQDAAHAALKKLR